MEHNRQDIRFLLQKYLDNKCTLGEIEELFEYIKKHPEDPLFEQSIEAEADSVINSKQEQLPDEISNSMLVSLQSKLHQKHPQKRHALNFNSRMLLQLAAVFLVGFVCVGYFYLGAGKEEIIEVQTQLAETKTIILPDRTTVVLNGNSSLRYDPNLSANEIREVHLKGEAFFTVAHTSDDKKFQVHNFNDIKIEVLGTEFTVNNRRSSMKVHLHTGKIRLDVQKENTEPVSIIMTPGEFIQITDENIIVKKNGYGGIGWTNNKFIFKDTPLQEILFLLEDNYGIGSVVSDSTLLKETFTATYPADINVLMKALSRSFDIRVDGSGTSKKIFLGNNPR